MESVSTRRGRFLTMRLCNNKAAHHVRRNSSSFPCNNFHKPDTLSKFECGFSLFLVFLRFCNFPVGKSCCGWTYELISPRSSPLPTDITRGASHVIATFIADVSLHHRINVYSSCQYSWRLLNSTQARRIYC